MQGTEMLNLIFAWHRKAFKFEALKVSIPGMFFRQNRQIAPFFAVVISLVLFFTACSPVRKLKENERLIVSNHIQVLDNSLPKEDLKAFIRQKPNKKTLGIWRLNLQLYNLVNQDKFIPRYEKRKQKRAEVNRNRAIRNEANQRKGKRRIKSRKDNPFSLARWLLNIGEPPVIYDSLLAHRSATQLELYLQSNGFFQASVKDTLILKHPQKADVHYNIRTGKAYKIGKVHYDISDETISSLVMADRKNSNIQSGEQYSTQKLDAERDRITDYLKDLGYYAFVKNYISYVADSSIGNKQVELSIEIANPEYKVPGFVDSTQSTTHKRYKINDIYVYGNYNLRPDSNQVNDTLYFNNTSYISSGLLKFKPNAIKSAIYIQRGDLYSKQLALRTYKRLSDYRAFKYINIQFKPLQADSSELLNCEIQVSPMSRQSFTFQTQATNTQGNIGVAGDLIYQNRNLFKGLELLELRLNAGLEVQRLASSESEGKNIQELIPFNTLLLGPELSLNFPKLIWPFRKIQKSVPKTRISSAYNFQKRPDYERSIFNLSYGYSWKPSAQKTLIFNPIEINFVNVTLGKNFEKLLNVSNNLFLKNSFTSQFITSSKVTWMYSGQIVGARKNFLFTQLNLESSGLFFSGTRMLYQNPGTDEQGKYLVLGTRYSQFIRFDTDFRYYDYLNKRASLAYRFILGLGIPYGNSDVMPFVRSFFSGGANDLRAWQARSIGPGSFRDSLGRRYDLIGDIKLELNAEYRLRVYKMFETAIFVDAGNVWLRKPNPSMVNGEFRFDRFYKEIAIGAGIGLRLNFDYFIIRLDAAHPIHDPSYIPGERWVYKQLMLSHLNFNLGIAYPF